MPYFKRIYSSFRNSLRIKKVDQQKNTADKREDDQNQQQINLRLRRKNKTDYVCEDDGYCSARTSLYSSTVTSPSIGPSPSSHFQSTASSSPRSYSNPNLSSTSKKRSKSSAASFPSPLSPLHLSSSVLHHDTHLNESYSLQNSVLSPISSNNSSVLSPLTTANASLNASSYIDPVSRSGSLSSTCTWSSKRKEVTCTKLNSVVKSSYDLLEDEVFEDIVEQLEEWDECGHSPEQHEEHLIKGNYEVIKKTMDEEDKNDKSFANESDSSIKRLVSKRLQRLTTLLRLFP